jgi:hypothetical protein
MAPTDSPGTNPSKPDPAAAPATSESTTPADSASPLDVGTRLAVQASLRRTTSTTRRR